MTAVDVTYRSPNNATATMVTSPRLLGLTLSLCSSGPVLFHAAPQALTLLVTDVEKFECHTFVVLEGACPLLRRTPSS